MATEEPVDLEEVARLVQALEKDLARLQSGSGDYVALKAEVEALREALHLTDETRVRERLHGLHRFLDEATDTAITGSQYIGNIGRMLGM